MKLISYGEWSNNVATHPDFDRNFLGSLGYYIAYLQYCGLVAAAFNNGYVVYHVENNKKEVIVGNNLPTKPVEFYWKEVIKITFEYIKEQIKKQETPF